LIEALYCTLRRRTQTRLEAPKIMANLHSDKLFTGSIPEIYEQYLVPLIFEHYARDLAKRVSEKPVSKVLEIAAGTGVVTRALADVLGGNVSIVATDLNKAMLDHGASVRVDKNVEWREADAMALPFEDAAFDAVLCQFGVMFFPDRIKAYAEALRVLKPGGRFIFNVWDEISENEFADTVTTSLVVVFPEDPPLFLPRAPHGYSDMDKIASELAKAGFAHPPGFETISARSIAAEPSIPAIAYCQGTPLRNEIENLDASLLQHATKIATAALAARFGEGTIDGKIQGHVVTISV
jgi:ubiquinone/menaquinone biosynthesis C-methylase UbiE